MASLSQGRLAVFSSRAGSKGNLVTYFTPESSLGSQSLRKTPEYQEFGEDIDLSVPPIHSFYRFFLIAKKKKSYTQTG